MSITYFVGRLTRIGRFCTRCDVYYDAVLENAKVFDDGKDLTVFDLVDLPTIHLNEFNDSIG